MNRRHFITNTAAIGASSAVGIHTATAAAPRQGSFVKPDAVILFQGDSITDAGRSREEAG